MRWFAAALSVFVCAPAGAQSPQGAGPPPDLVAFKACQDAAVEDLAASAPCFADVGTHFPKSDIAAVAWFNAAVAAEKAGDADAVVVACKTLVQRYPKAEHAASAIALWADTLDRLGDIEGATQHRLRLVSQFPDHDEAREGMQSVLAWYAASADPKLVSASEKYVALWPGDSDASWAASLPVLGAGASCRDVLKRGAAWLKRWGFDGHRGDRVALAVARCHVATGDRKGAHTLYSRLAATQRHAALEATFRLTDLDRDELRTKKPKSVTTGDLSRELKERVVATGELVRRYERVVGYGSVGSVDGGLTWRMAAAVRIAELYEQLAADLRALPIPPEVAKDPGARSAYEAALADQLDPMEDRAVQGYEGVVLKAAEFRWHDEFVGHARARLTALRPARWPAPAGKAELDVGPAPGPATTKEGGAVRARSRLTLAHQAVGKKQYALALYLLDGADDSAEAMNLHAVVVARQGNYGEALSVLSAASSLAPTDPVVAGNLARLRTALGLVAPD